MGNATVVMSRPSMMAVHPHVHGERESSSRSIPLLLGSSPRTWGTRRRSPARRIRRRFIPTYMGNAAPGPPALRCSSVHPHVHGEREEKFRSHEGHNGSSPRTWGTPDDRAVEWRSNRFIPTYMGNAGSGAKMLPISTVHPHVHGERESVPGVVCLGNGSSPRTWGTL